MIRIVLSCVAAIVLLCTTLGPATSIAAEKKIAIIWVGPSPAAQDCLRSFLPRLRELAPEVKVTIRKGLPDMAEGEKAFRELESSMDGIIFLRSNGAQFLATARPKIPCFVGVTNNPQFLGAVNNLDAPEGNITGVTYYIPYEKRFEAMKDFFPKVRSVALFMDKDHPTASIESKGVQEQCQRLGLAYHECAGTSETEFLKAAQELAGKSDLFIFANHASVEKITDKISQIARSKKVPVFSFGDAPLKLGALASLSAREDVLGSLLADSVVDVVVKGKPVSQVPVKVDPEPRITLNEQQMDFFGLRLRPSVLRNARIIRQE